MLDRIAGYHRHIEGCLVEGLVCPYRLPLSPGHTERKIMFQKCYCSAHLFCSKVVAHLLADHVGGDHVEGVVTQGAPRPTHVDLDNLPALPVLQP